MKCIYVTGLRGFPNVQGGIEKHCEELYPRLSMQDSYAITVLTRSRYQDRQLREYKGVYLRPIWAPNTSGVEAFVHTFLCVIYAGIKRPDILHIHALGPGIFTLLARLFFLKVVFTHHGFDYKREKWGRASRLVLRAGEWAAIKCSSKVIAVSKIAANELKQKYGAQINVVRNGVTLPSTKDDLLILPNLGLTKEAYFLTVSRIVEEKRQIDIIKAFKKLKTKNVKLVVIGNGDGGPYHSTVVDEIQGDSQIVMAGALYGDTLATLFRYSLCFVHASSLEGNPIVVLEAMSFGLPLLVSDIAAHSEIELDKDEYFPLGNIENLAKKMNEKMSSAQRNKFSDKIEYVSREFDWGIVAKKTAKVYDSVF